MYPVLLQTPDNASGSHFICSQKENNSNPQSYPLVNQLYIFSIKGYPAPDARRAPHISHPTLNTLLGLISVSAGFIPTHVKAPYDQTCYRRSMSSLQEKHDGEISESQQRRIFIGASGEEYLYYVHPWFIVWLCHVIVQFIWPKKPMRQKTNAYVQGSDSLV